MGFRRAREPSILTRSEHFSQTYPISSTAPASLRSWGMQCGHRPRSISSVAQHRHACVSSSPPENREVLTLEASDSSCLVRYERRAKRGARHRPWVAGPTHRDGGSGEEGGEGQAGNASDEDGANVGIPLTSCTALGMLQTGAWNEKKCRSSWDTKTTGNGSVPGPK